MSLFKKNQPSAEPRRYGCLRSCLICFVVYLGLSVLCGILFGSLMDSSVKLKDDTVYVLKMKGTLVEQGPEDDPFGGVLEDMPYMNSDEVVGLDDLKENILFAKEDKRIRGIMLNVEGMSMGQASAKALRDALADFKQSGKFVYAYADNYSQMNYYVASVADIVMLNPVGSVDWNGLSAEKMYYKRLLEKVGIDMQIVKVGTFKSAVEPFIRTSMSEADKAQTMRYMQGIWDVMKRGVAQNRNIEIATLDALADRYMGLQTADDCRLAGLVDTLLYREQVDSLLKKQMDVKKYNTISTASLLSVERVEHKVDNEIAVLYAEGDIVDSGNEGISSKKIRKQINKIYKDKNVKALVLRVNSPGGSASASEAIWYALSRLKEKNKPVIVSMGDYAASGGYYISSGADYIFAEENTITGSIGIFGMIPSFAQLRDKLGVDIDGVNTNKHSDLEVNATYKGMNETEYALMQRMVDNGYDLFTRRCAEGRGKTQDEIKQIAEGRVWLGTDALNLGLVDELGGMEQAIVKAADLAELSDYKVVYYPEKKDFLTTLMERFDTSTTEERLVKKIRQMCAESRIMAWWDAPVIK